ncbi:MAG: hypothetical protein QXW86_12380 [Saccharolobus sp.]|uniref:hypothetical protein n=1 Tax=Saccharolobus sp. TaxID=2100761 RepID=UPI00316DD378
MLLYYVVLISFSLLSLMLAHLLVLKKREALFILMFLGFFIWLLYFLILSPSWILANGDLIYMLKTYQKVVEQGVYLFNDIELMEVRPNYVLYPTSFILQGILSIVTSINAEVLMYIPLANFASYIAMVAITWMLIRNVKRDLLPIVVLPIFSFLGLSFTSYFVYSQIIRFLILLQLYILIQKMDRITTLILLIPITVASVLGHVQEPHVFAILISLYLLIYSASRYLFKNEHNYKKENIFYLYYIILMVLILTYDIFPAQSVFEGVIMFIKRLIEDFIYTSPEIVSEKLGIAGVVLTPLEVYIILIGYITVAIYVVYIFLKHLVISIKVKNCKLFALTLTPLIYGFIAVIPFFETGILQDLFWRPMWVFLALISTSSKFLTKYNVNYHKTYNKSRNIVKVIYTAVIIALFLFANIIYNRYHLIPSEVYLHEDRTLNLFTNLPTNIQTQLDYFIGKAQHTVIIDSPDMPGYEISKLLWLMLKRSPPNITTYYLDPEITVYNVSYLNGVIKTRNLAPNINIQNNLCIKEACTVIASTTAISRFQNTSVLLVVGDISIGLR